MTKNTTMKNSMVNAKELQMLELLAQGGTSKSMALNMGYREGTMRVYMHHLYRKLGVNSKTRAVTWYLANVSRDVDGADATPTMAASGPAGEETFGDMALRTDLLAAFGVMNTFFGAHGRMWEVATRLKGGAIDKELNLTRRTSRQLWEALLAGDFAHAKRLYDRGVTPKLFIDSPPDCLLVGVMLLIGGYSNAADQVISQLKKREKGRLGISVNEYKMIRALRDALDQRSENSDTAIMSLYRMANENSSQQVFKHVVMAALFYVYRERQDFERAGGTANAMLAEAEGVRQHLQAMGEKPLYKDASLPEPANLPTKELHAYLEKLAYA
jgi:DNA-binding CsgD family transcriptional regulator